MAGSWEQHIMEEFIRTGQRGRMYARRPDAGADIRCAMCALDPQALPDEAREVFTIIFGYAICEDHFMQIFPGEDEAIEMRLRNLLEEQIRKDIRGQLEEATRVEERRRRQAAERRMRERLDATRVRGSTPFGEWLNESFSPLRPDEVPYGKDLADMSSEAREEAEAFLKAQEANRNRKD